MINTDKLKTAIAAYKDYFPTKWPNEKYKWAAVKHFQDNWDIKAADFASMFETATDKTINLLASGYFYPRAMIIAFAKADAEATRAMFMKLFDESVDLAERVEQFQIDAEHMRETHDDGTWKSHYQNTNAISTYLWLRYPDKYYIYKYSEYVAVAKELESDFMPKRTSSPESMIGGYKLYDEICKHLQQDEELVSMFKSALTENSYPDESLRTLTIDFGYYISRYYNEKVAEESVEWLHSDYSPNISVDDWVELLGDSEVFTNSSLEIMRRMKDYGGEATCKQLATKYGGAWGFYNIGSSSLAQRVAAKTGIPPIKGTDGRKKWWPILYVGRQAEKDEEGTFIWKLREELNEALDKVDLEEIALYANTGAAIWKVSHGPGPISDAEYETFKSQHVIVVHEDTRSKAKSKVPQGHDFINSMKIGDYFYLCRGNSIILLGQVISEKATLNPDKKDGWFQREYEVVAHSIDTSPYKNTQKWWTPNDNSTFVKVGEHNHELFEHLILKPYFDINVDTLLGEEKEVGGYWWLNANPKVWSFSNIKVGEVIDFTLYNETGNKRRIFQNFLDAKAGDVVIGYESYPVKQVVALAKVAQEEDGENLYFEKVEGLSVPIDYETLKNSPELERMEYFTNPRGSLFKLTEGEYEFIFDMIREGNPVTPVAETLEGYTKEDFLREVYMPKERLENLLALLKDKKNIIIQGAPGVGKTFAARRLAYARMGKKDYSRVKFIQFHQNYAYEDFVMGYKPQGDSFKLVNGIFYQFCQQAANNPGEKFFFIIDEINRGNMSKIFGELLMLIEKDYRGTKATLAYSGMPFSVPKNLYLIGLMNTADRSLAMIDYALRRRFSFFTMEPAFKVDGFKDYQKGLDNETFNELIEKIIELNEEISNDHSLGPGFCIGHSYFCNQEKCEEDWMKRVVNNDIIPMLSEYWFDEREKLQKWENKLRGIFNV